MKIYLWCDHTQKRGIAAVDPDESDVLEADWYCWEGKESHLIVEAQALMDSKNVRMRADARIVLSYLGGEIDE